MRPYKGEPHMRILLILIISLGFVWSSASSEAQSLPQGWGLRPKHSLPPLGSGGELLEAHVIRVGNPEAAPQAPQKTAPTGADVVPPADTPSIADDVDDTETEAAVEPHVEEDSAGGLVDMGDVGGDFEE